MDDPVRAMLIGLIDGLHVLAPDDLPAPVRRHADPAGLRDAWIYLVDVQQHVLVPLPVAAGPEAPWAVVVGGSIAGRVFWSQLVLDTAAGPLTAARRWLWVPIVDGTERLGVLRLTVEHTDADTTAAATHLAGLVALLLVSKRPFNDTAAVLTRSEPMNMAAEMQWSLLPPLTIATDAVGAAMDRRTRSVGTPSTTPPPGSILHLAVFDAMGHDLQAGVVAGLAASAWRYARRRGEDLDRAAAIIDAATEQQFQRRRYITGVLAALNTATGRLRWVNRGDPCPLLIGAGHAVHELKRATDPMMGLSASNTILDEQLHPGTGFCCTPTASPMPRRPAVNASDCTVSPTSSSATTTPA